MGNVYEAIDPEIDRRVAIKVLRRELLADNPELLQRLFIEARAANAIGHPGVVQISEAKLLGDGTGYLVMEYLDGQTLTQRLNQSGGRLPIHTALDLAIQIAGTLRAGHQRGVVHRDVKPDNIMLVPDDAIPGGERVKILDFGIAKLVRAAVGAAPLTLVDMGLGTPGYMAPEQLRAAADASDRSDIYGLGAVLFQMLAGRRPHVAETQADLLVQVLSTDAPPVSDFVPEIPPSLVQLLQAQLNREHADARPSIVEVLQRLYLIRAELAGGRPVSAQMSPTPVSASQSGDLSSPAGGLFRREDSLRSSSKTSDSHVTSSGPANLSGPVSAGNIRPPSASTISQHTGQQLEDRSPGTKLTKNHKWMLGTIAAATLLAGSFLVGLREKSREATQNKPEQSEVIETKDGHTPSAARHVQTANSDVASGPITTGDSAKPPTAPLNTTVSTPERVPEDHQPDKTDGSPTAGRPRQKRPQQTPAPGKTKEKLLADPATRPKAGVCQERPSVLDSPAPAVTRAVADAVAVYKLHLCKGERLVIQRNTRDGVLLPISIPRSIKERSSFDMRGFLLRIQGDIATANVNTITKITIGS